MFELFKNEYTETEVKHSFYYKMFKENFCYRFGRPQVDRCCQCKRLNVKLKDKNLNPVTNGT